MNLLPAVPIVKRKEASVPEPCEKPWQERVDQDEDDYKGIKYVLTFFTLLQQPDSTLPAKEVKKE